MGLTVPFSILLADRIASSAAFIAMAVSAISGWNNRHPGWIIWLNLALRQRMRRLSNVAAALLQDRVQGRTSLAAAATRNLPVRTLVIGRPQDARKLLGVTRRYDSIHVRIPALRAAENLRLASELQDNYVQCGCRTARLTVVSALSALALVLAATDASASNWSAGATAIGAVALLTLLAMVSRIAAARLRVARVVKRLQALPAAAASRQRRASGGRRPIAQRLERTKALSHSRATVAAVRSINR